MSDVLTNNAELSWNSGLLWSLLVIASLVTRVFGIGKGITDFYFSLSPQEGLEFYSFSKIHH